MKMKKIISCFLAAAAICMTCSLTACRKEDGDVSKNTSKTTDNHTDDRHTENPTAGIHTDDGMDDTKTNEHGASSATPVSTPATQP